MRNYHSVSSVKTFATCPRQYHYLYDLGLRPIDTNLDLDFGNYGHAYLQKRLAGENRTVALAYAQEMHPLSEHWNTIATVVLRAYEELLPEYKPLLVEEEFEVQLEGHTFKGRIDLLAEHPRAGTILVDHKFTRSADLSTYTAYREFDPQLQLYAYAVEKVFKRKLELVEYNVLRRPLLRQKRGEDLNEFYDRIDETVRSGGYFARIPVPTNDLLQFQAISDLTEYVTLLEQGVRPRNASSCVQYGSPCAFQPVCAGNVEAEPNELYRLRQNRG